MAGREGEGGFKGGANSENWFYRFNPVFCSLAVLQLQNCRKWYFKDEGERLKSSFSSFHLVKTAAGGKPVISCNYVLRRRHCSEQGCLSLPYKLHLKLTHFLCQPFYAVLVLAGKAVHFLHGAVYLLNACRHFVHAVFYDGGELIEFAHLVRHSFAAN